MDSNYAQFQISLTFKYGNICIKDSTYTCRSSFVNLHDVSTRSAERSPAMIGSEFAVDRKFFLRLGGYDPGLEIWGGEEMEVSFKTWMCGGSMVEVPCSCVAHLFRSRKHRVTKSYIRNKIRVAEIWMDQYKEDVYQRMGKEAERADIGDISDMVKLRVNLGCRSFDWYLQNVASMVYVARDKVTQGEIHNVEKPGICLVGTPYPGRQAVTASGCSGRGAYQFWILTKAGQVRKDTTCLGHQNEDNVEVSPCAEDNPFQFWNNDEFVRSKRLKNKASSLCLSLEQGNIIAMEKCTEENRQKWTFVPRKRTLKDKT